jgi:Gpi18-like mannosyltransferase
MALNSEPASGLRDRGEAAGLVLLVTGFSAGIASRYAALDHKTADAVLYLLPWYEFAREHGIASLGRAFTNYTPFYSYLLFIVSRFDGWAEPWHLIKAISFVFEFGCAALAARFVSLGGARMPAPAAAFTCVWIAPTVFYNGAMWGQADAIWTFFCLLSVYCLCRDKPGFSMIAFGLAFAVKAQAVFLGPFIFGFLLRRKIHWAWIAAVPAAYLALALPAVLFGQPLTGIVSVYWKQSETFRLLSANAANLWWFVPNKFYTIGVIIGIVAASAAGLAISVWIARRKSEFQTAAILFAAALSLFLMPFLLPKMHDRYFYAFEVIAIPLACLDRRFVAIALGAQVTGVLAYFAFDGLTKAWLPVAAIGNAAICAVLLSYALAQSAELTARAARS